MSDEIPFNLPIAVRTAYLTMHRQAEAVLRPAGLTANQFVVLWILSKKEVTQSELAEYAASDRNTIRPVLLSLEKKKWIRRKPHPTDGRSLVVALTASGQRKFAKVEQLGTEFRTELESEFSERELARFGEFLVRVQRHFLDSE